MDHKHKLYPHHDIIYNREDTYYVCSIIKQKLAFEGRSSIKQKLAFERAITMALTPYWRGEISVEN